MQNALHIHYALLRLDWQGRHHVGGLDSRFLFHHQSILPRHLHRRPGNLPRQVCCNRRRHLVGSQPHVPPGRRTKSGARSQRAPRRNSGYSVNLDPSESLYSLIRRRRSDCDWAAESALDRFEILYSSSGPAFSSRAPRMGCQKLAGGRAKRYPRSNDGKQDRTPKGC